MEWQEFFSMHPLPPHVAEVQMAVLTAMTAGSKKKPLDYMISETNKGGAKKKAPKKDETEPSTGFVKSSFF